MAPLLDTEDIENPFIVEILLDNTALESAITLLQHPKRRLLEEIGTYHSALNLLQ